MDKLQNLESLNLGENLFIKVPPAVLKLQKLRVLQIDNNHKLQTLKDAVLRLDDLQKVEFTTTEAIVDEEERKFINFWNEKKFHDRLETHGRHIDLLRRFYSARQQ